MDIYSGACRRAISFGLDVSPFRNCNAHLARMHGRAGVKKPIAHEKTVMAVYARAA